jgi:predicted nucleic acid-binding protein
VVFDTNVLAYALLGVTEHRERALDALEHAPDVHVPDVAYAEFANVAWQWISIRGLPEHEAHAALALAEKFVTHATPSADLWHTALELSTVSGVAVYDTLFVALALIRDEPLLTFDRRVLDTFPEVARRP